MKFDEIKKICQTTNPDEVNQKLIEGYEIVKIISSKISTSNCEQILPMYVLGYGG